MLINSEDLEKLLFEAKQRLFLLLDKAKTLKVKASLDGKIEMIDYLFMWLSTSKQKGEVIMEPLKLGEFTTWEEKPRIGSIDSKIIEDAKRLRRNMDAIKVTVEKINWVTFQNRAYQLRKEGKISEHILPRRNEDGTPFLVYFDEVKVRRSKVNNR